MLNLPRILIIHLQQAAYGRYGPFKDCREIEFPYTINMNRFLDGDDGSDGYRLISIASHVGLNSKGGHYISFWVVEW
jgi:hypothetical protein